MLVKKNRISWEQFALNIATVVADRSEDPYIKVGACVLRYDNSVAGVGYNGPPAGIEIDWSDRDKRRLRIVHAEPNALRYCKPNEGALIAVTLLPCQSCTTLIASYGIKKIVYRDVYDRDQTAFQLCKEFGIKLVQLD